MNLTSFSALGHRGPLCGTGTRLRPSPVPWAGSAPPSPAPLVALCGLSDAASGALGAPNPGTSGQAQMPPADGPGPPAYLLLFAAPGMDGGGQRNHPGPRRVWGRQADSSSKPSPYIQSAVVITSRLTPPSLAPMPSIGVSLSPRPRTIGSTSSPGGWPKATPYPIPTSPSCPRLSSA
jgi:hypothetical protein